MSSPESSDTNPDRLISDAQQGFDISYAFVPLDADHLRLGAADMLQEGAGELLYKKLTALGLTDAQIDRLAEDGLLEETLQRLAPDEMEEIKRRVQDIVVTDPHARSALESVVYLTDVEQGRIKND